MQDEISNSKTLFEIVGATQPSVAWSNSVLLVIDAQKEYENGILELPNIRPSVKVIQNLLNGARGQQAPIIHIVHESAEGPFNKKKKNGSFMVNYRYSTLSIFKKIGLDFGTGSAVPGQSIP